LYLDAIKFIGWIFSVVDLVTLFDDFLEFCLTLLRLKIIINALIPSKINKMVKNVVMVMVYILYMLNAKLHCLVYNYS